ncbi:hypothetical protein GE09DRAFT_1236352 [Coniochaeta sp. 2T2.1]|nr:hypothetical protein GE09DRAFT_1236352 [Coniochaeta sp. 2T2.1]
MSLHDEPPVGGEVGGGYLQMHFHRRAFADNKCVTLHIIEKTTILSTNSISITIKREAQHPAPATHYHTVNSATTSIASIRPYFLQSRSVAQRYQHPQSHHLVIPKPSRWRRKETSTIEKQKENERRGSDDIKRKKQEEEEAKAKAKADAKAKKYEQRLKRSSLSSND